MHGLMMDTPLLISSLMRFADTNYPDREIISLTVDNLQQRHTYREVFARTRKLANALKRLGVKAGERVGTLAWNDHRHFELYYALSGSGVVCHTINPRLYREQIAYIVNHAEDRYLFVDPLVMPLVEALIEKEKVSVASGVPTIWLELLAYLERTGNKIETVNRVSVGGAACPLSIIEDFDKKHGVTVHQGWGMTETSRSEQYSRSSRTWASCRRRTATSCRQNRAAVCSVSKCA